MKKLDSAHDLSKGEREYLKQQKISPRDFDRMSSEDQKDWKREMKEPAYEHMRNWEKKEGSDWEHHRMEKHKKLRK